MNEIACRSYTHGEHDCLFQWRGSFNRRDTKSKRFAVRTFVCTARDTSWSCLFVVTLSVCTSSNHVRSYWTMLTKLRGRDMDRSILILWVRFTYSDGFKNTWFKKLPCLSFATGVIFWMDRFNWHKTTSDHLTKKKYALDQFKYWSMCDKAWPSKSSWTARRCAGMEREERKGALVGRKGQR